MLARLYARQAPGYSRTFPFQDRRWASARIEVASGFVNLAELLRTREDLREHTLELQESAVPPESRCGTWAAKAP